MKWLRRRYPRDERIEQIKNSIYREMYWLVNAIAGISIITKLILGMDIQSMLTELVIVTAASLYYLFRIVQKGIYSDEVEIHDHNSKLPMSVKQMLIGIGIGIVVALFFGIRSAVLYGDKKGEIETFLIVFLASFMIYVPFLLLYAVIAHASANKLSRIAAANNDEAAENGDQA